jgi:hypothetical protein
VSRVTRHARLSIACATLAFTTTASLSAQFGIFKRNKGTTYQAYRDPGSKFVIEYPVKDWKVNPAKGSNVVSFTQKDNEAAVVVDHTKLKLALAKEEIDDVVMKLEVDALKEKDPTARDVNASVAKGPAGPRIVIRYTRNGIAGREQVEQQSIAAGDDLYRVSCSSLVKEQERYQPILSYIASSFSLLRTQS